jgi:adenosylmethionine-8-amino-7-oxononanoate aminotransferase
MGRTGTLHAVEQEGVVPDLMAIAKGLGGGYQPIGAVLAANRIIEPIRAGSGLFQHGHTYSGHPTAAAAALAVQQVIQRDALLPAVHARGAYLRRALVDRFGEHPHVGDIRGRGLFMGVELVKERAGKTPFDPSARLHARVKAEAMANGLLVYPMGGTIDGRSGDHILLAPPFIATESDIDRIADLLAASIQQAIEGVSPQ